MSGRFSLVKHCINTWFSWAARFQCLSTGQTPTWQAYGNSMQFPHKDVALDISTCDRGDGMIDMQKRRKGYGT